MSDATQEVSRHKLSQKQYDRFTKAREKAQAAQQAFHAAKENLETVAELVLDAFGVSPTDQVSLDDVTKELVVTKTPEAPASPAPEAPAAPVPEVPSPAK